MSIKNFENFLQNKFINLREIGGVPIIKDNAEDLFDSWLSNLDSQELIDYADQAIDEVKKENKIIG